MSEEIRRNRDEGESAAVHTWYESTNEQGIQYSLDRLQASFQTFANHFLDSDLLKGIIDFGNGAINVIDTVASKIGSLGTIGLSAGLFAGIKNVGGVKVYTPVCFEYADNNMCSLGY